MRSDQWGEFTSKEFKKFCEANGIQNPLTIPRFSQKNGVAERKNETILRGAKHAQEQENAKGILGGSYGMFGVFI